MDELFSLCVLSLKNLFARNFTMVIFCSVRIEYMQCNVIVWFITVCDFGLIISQLVPESPRYLIFKGKEEKAKKVLSLIAKLNHKQLPVGRLVTTEEKERLLKERSPSPDEVAESTTGMLEDDETKNAINGTLPNIDLTVISSDNESDSELLLDEHTYRRKQIINKLVSYYHWILILFKNGWWRTTLLLWYLW